MPATAGRVRMPANNRVHSSAALQTHGIWQSAIGYDPYAPNKEDKKDSSHKSSNAEPDAENAYASFQGLLALARITNSNADVDRGACKKCGRVGHLKFQCKNHVRVKDDNEEKDPEAVLQVPVLVGLDKLKENVGKVDRKSKVESSVESDEEDDNESSDSDVDSEIERIIAKRFGKKISGKAGSSRMRRGSDEDGSDTDSGRRKKRGRSKKRAGKRESSDSGERRRKRRKEHRRKRDKSQDEDDDRCQRRSNSRKEKRRRKSGRSDSESETSEGYCSRRREKSKRAASLSGTDSSCSGDSTMGRDMKRSEKSWRRHCDR